MTDVEQRGYRVPAVREPAGQFDPKMRYDEEAEQATIGAILQSPAALEDVIGILKGPEDFWSFRHGAIYKTALEVRGRGEKVDPYVVLASMDANLMAKVGGGPYLHTCMSAAPTIANGAHYAALVRKAAKLRDLLEYALRVQRLATSAATNDADDVVARAQREAAELAAGGGASTMTVWSDLGDDVAAEMDRIAARAQLDTLPGVPTGWPDFDRLVSNLQPGQLVVIAARPGMGKTVAGLNIAQHAAMEAAKRALMFSAEMSAVEIGMRLLAAGAEIPLHVIRSGKLSDLDCSKAGHYFGETEAAELYVDDTPNVSLSHMEAAMYRLDAQDKRPDVVIVDYLGLMQPPDARKPRREQIGDLTRGLKQFGRRWGVPVILLAQLNRGNEQRTDKRPQLSDLRDSGDVEQDADIVVLLHRDDYYDKESPRAGEVDFIVAKHRGGPTDTITMAAQLHFSRFMSMAIA